MSDQDWKPAFHLDLEKASAAAFDDIRKRHAEWGAKQPVTPLPFTKNGWYTITPEMAETLLIRNAANRAPSLAVVTKYARMQKAGDWKRTGQPLIFNRDGKGEDYPHGVWACYLWWASLEFYVVMDVPVDPVMFAYYDGGKPRSGVDALQTAGFNGTSSAIVAAIIMADRYEAGGFLWIGTQPKMVERSIPSTLAFVQSNQDIVEVAHTLTTHYAGAVKAIANRGVAVFVGWQLLTLYGAGYMESFFQGIGYPEELEDSNPLAALRRRFDLDVVSQDKAWNLTRSQRIGLLIKASNMLRRGEPAEFTRKEKERALSFLPTDRFPRFDAVAVALAAQ